MKQQRRLIRTRERVGEEGGLKRRRKRSCESYSGFGEEDASAAEHLENDNVWSVLFFLPPCSIFCIVKEQCLRVEAFCVHTLRCRKRLMMLFHGRSGSVAN